MAVPERTVPMPLAPAYVGLSAHHLAALLREMPDLPVRVMFQGVRGVESDDFESVAVESVTHLGEGPYRAVVIRVNPGVIAQSGYSAHRFADTLVSMPDITTLVVAGEHASDLYADVCVERVHAPGSPRDRRVLDSPNVEVALIFMD
jgi:hypothetical protein